MAFSEILRTLIDERDLTQKQLAQDLHIPVSTLGGYVQGTSEPDVQKRQVNKVLKQWEQMRKMFKQVGPKKGKKGRRGFGGMRIPPGFGI